MTKFNYTKIENPNDSIICMTRDYFDIGRLNCRVETYAMKNCFGTYNARYSIAGSFGWAGGVGFKAFTVNEKATPEEAYEKVVRKAERWISKYLENY